MTWPDLRPCPFCGKKEARVVMLDDEGYGIPFENKAHYKAGNAEDYEEFCRMVEEDAYTSGACISCPCGASLTEYCIDEAIEKWNRRERE